jgi:hypothetical protein
MKSPLAAVGLLSVLLTSCASLIADKHTYDAGAASPAVVVNGATVRLRMKPEGTGKGSMAVSLMVVSAAKATMDGPFRWRLDAEGREGHHEWVIVHRIRTLTSITKRDERYPERHLGERASFRKREDAFRASYLIPGVLNVKPREDGALEVLVDLTVRADGRSVRQTARFRMQPAHKRADEFVFIPAEIVNHIGKPKEDWEESGWD